MKFTGRTPSPVRQVLSPKARGAARPQPARALALRVALAMLAMCLLSGLARDFIGAAPAVDSALQIVSAAPDFSPAAQLQATPAGLLSTVGALGVFWAEMAAQLGKNGAIWLILPILVCATLWWGLALLGEWRRPPIVLLALLLVQLWAAGHLLAPLLPPTQKIQTDATALAFQFDDEPLSPRQAIARCRARGASVLVFVGRDRVLPRPELDALRAANADLVLLNGCEYRGAAHLIFVGAKEAITSKAHDVPAAMQAADKQGALVFAFPETSGWDTVLQLLQRGPNGLIAAPDATSIKDANVLVKSSGGVAIVASSGETAWTLLPGSAKSLQEIARDVRARRVAVAFAPNAKTSRGNPLAGSARVAWNKLSRAQRAATIFGALAVLASLAFWGAGARAAGLESGPQRVVGFLRKRRMGGRMLGLFFMLLAWLGTVAIVAWSVFGLMRETAQWSPLYALPIFAALTMLYVYGRRLWRQVQ